MNQLFWKVFLLGSVFFVGISFAAEASELLEKLKNSPKAVDASQVANVKDPFFGEGRGYLKGLKETNASKYEPSFALKAIFADKALINDRWIAKGEALEGYILEVLGDKGVTLSRDGEKKTLSLVPARTSW